MARALDEKPDSPAEMVNALIRIDPTVLSTIVRLAPEIANDSSLLAAVFDGARRSDGPGDRGAIRVVRHGPAGGRVDPLR